jgi:hypothetical protein
METLEREIIEKFRQLEPAGQARVLSVLQTETQAREEAEPFDREKFLAELDEVAIELQPDASGRVPSVAEMVNEVREERDADILRSLIPANAPRTPPDYSKNRA